MQAMTQPPMTTNPGVAPQQPMLGPQVPGTTGSLAAPRGLNVFSNPLAQQLQSQGRGQDTMLVHMTPGEVNSLQGLARAAGGSLTINPHTGLPEAGFLSGILPMLGGALLSFTGIGAPLAAGLVGAADTAITGSLSKGLMAGLGAFGGASLAGGLAAGASAGAGAATTGAATAEQTAAAGAQAASDSALAGSTSAATAAGADVPLSQVNSAFDTALSAPAGPTNLVPTAMSGPAGAATFTPNAGQALAPSSIGAGAPAGTNNFLTNFSNAARTGLTGTPAAIAPYAAGLGVLNGVSSAFQGTPGKGPEAQVPVYKGPYHYADRGFNGPPPMTMNAQGIIQPISGTYRYYSNPNPQVLDAQGNPAIYETAPLSSIDQYGNSTLPGYAEGGAMPIKDGSFIVDARTVSELGNGSSSAGQDLLARHGGKPLHGPGDGVSDSIPASIGGVQKARVARDEVKFDPEDVSRIGDGRHSEGVKKLYALMDKAHKARKKAKPGQDTKLAKGLGAL